MSGSTATAPGGTPQRSSTIVSRGGDDDTKSLHTDYHFHSVRWEDPNFPGTCEATHPDGYTKWLCEFVLHDRVLAFVPQ